MFYSIFTACYIAQLLLGLHANNVVHLKAISKTSLTSAVNNQHFVLNSILYILIHVALAIVMLNIYFYNINHKSVFEPDSSHRLSGYSTQLFLTENFPHCDSLHITLLSVYFTALPQKMTHTHL